MKKDIAIPVIAVACAGFGIAATGSLAADIEVLFTKIPGHPTSVIPGAEDLDGNPVVTNFRAFHDLIGSPDGSHWLLRGRTQLGSDLENIMLLGTGATANTIAQEGRPIPGGQPGELYDFFGSGVGRFNDNNDFAYSARARGGVSAHAQKIIRYINGLPEIVMQQGDPYIGLIDAPGNISGDELVGNSVGSVHLLNDGTIGIQDTTIQNCHSTRRPAIFYNNIAFHQKNVTTVLGMDGQSSFFWDDISANTFYTTPSTSPISLGKGEDRWIAHGRRSGQALSDRCFVVDGQIILETGAPLPGAPNIVSSINQSHVITNGDWYVRGASDGGTRVWAMRNGAVVALTSDSVEGGDERWAAQFTQFTGNSRGDWVLIGRTDHPDPTLNDVIVVNGQVVVRKGDPVDLDGNGQFDDNVFIGRSNPANAAFPGDAFLTDDGYLYFLANIMDADGNEYNSDPVFGPPLAVLRVKFDSAEPCVGDLSGDGAVDVSDLLMLLGAWGQCPRGADCPGDLNSDGAVDVSDLLMLLAAWGECP